MRFPCWCFYCVSYLSLVFTQKFLPQMSREILVLITIHLIKIKLLYTIVNVFGRNPLFLDILTFATFHTWIHWNTLCWLYLNYKKNWFKWNCSQIRLYLLKFIKPTCLLAQIFNHIVYKFSYYLMWFEIMQQIFLSEISLCRVSITKFLHTQHKFRRFQVSST